MVPLRVRVDHPPASQRATRGRLSQDKAIASGHSHRLAETDLHPPLAAQWDHLRIQQAGAGHHLSRAAEEVHLLAVLERGRSIKQQPQPQVHKLRGAE
jgi:hypothetical protein